MDKEKSTQWEKTTKSWKLLKLLPALRERKTLLLALAWITELYIKDIVQFAGVTEEGIEDFFKLAFALANKEIGRKEFCTKYRSSSISRIFTEDEDEEDWEAADLINGFTKGVRILQDAFNRYVFTTDCDVARLLREIFGNPFRPVVMDPAWLTPTIISLAQAAYDERLLLSGHLDPARLAVLSDALEESGCTAEILAHLRSPGPHVRGCWALDLVLGKE